MDLSGIMITLAVNDIYSGVIPFSSVQRSITRATKFKPPISWSKNNGTKMLMLYGVLLRRNDQITSQIGPLSR